MRHGPDEVRVLRNIGIAAPSPIRYYYKWPGRFKPYSHQIETAAFLTDFNRAFNLNDLGCVDSETEYLSPTGWVKISEYSGGEVAQYHPETGKAEFVTPTEFVKLRCDEMIHVKTKYGVDQLLSPEHRMIVRDRIRPEKYEVVQAAELMARQEMWFFGQQMPAPFNRKLGKPEISYSGCTIPTTFDIAPGPGIPLSDAELRVQIAVIADGHFPPKLRTQQCVIRLKKQRKKDRLRRLLSAASIPWREREQNTATAQGFTVFSFPAPWRCKEFDDRFWSATREQLLIVRDEVMYWDGHNRADTPTSKKGYSFSTFVKASADFVQYAYCATGAVARVIESKRERRGKTEVEYVVMVRTSGNTNLQLKGTGSNGAKYRSMRFAPSTDGFKYCFMVPSTFLVFRRNGCVFASGNTGKTVSTLWAYDYLRECGVAQKTLIVTPLSTLERTWADELFQHFPHLSYAVLHGSRERRLDLLKTDVDCYLINHHGIKVRGVVEALAKRADINLIIVDELAQVGRTASTDMWKALNIVCNKQMPRLVWGLTGMPLPNGPMDAWAQCRLLVPERVPPYANRFREKVMRQVATYLWVPKAGAMDVVHEAMQPAIRYNRDECIDLPECVFETRTVELTAAQKAAYKDMLNKLRAEIDNGEVLAVNEAVKAQKLIQIACGSVYGDSEDALLLDAGPRLQVVLDTVEEASTKVIVFVPFVAIVKRVTDFLRQNGHSVEFIHSDVGKSERDRIFGAFQRDAHPRVIVATPGTMSHGLTMTAASTIIWYAPITSNDTFGQANARITRPGQKHSQLILMIEGTEVERRYYKRLKDKEKTQGILLDMIKATQTT